MKQRQEKRYLVFLLLIPFLIFIILKIIGFDGLYGQDSYEYLRYTNSLKGFLCGGPYPGDFAWPKGYLILTALLSFVVSASLSGQLLSLAFLYGTYFFLYKTILLVYRQHHYSRIYLIMAVLISPYLLRLGVVMMVDTLAMFTLVAASYYALKYQKFRTFSSLLLCCIMTSYGVFSRYAVAVPLIAVVLWTFIHWVKQPKWLHLLVLIVPLLLLSIHHYLEAQGSAFMNHHFIKNWSVSNFFATNFNAVPGSTLPQLSYAIPNFIYYIGLYFHPGFFFMNLLVLIIGYRNLRQYLAKQPLLIFGGIIFYTVFLWGITFQSSRYLSLTYPLLCLLVYPAFRDFMMRFKSKNRSIVVIFIIIQLCLFYRAIWPSFKMNQFERSLAESMKEYEGSTLYSFAVDVSLKGRGLAFNYKNLWENKYESFEEKALVLFNEERFEQKWKAKNPMLNWDKLNDHYQLNSIAKYEEGWELYKIEALK